MFKRVLVTLLVIVLGQCLTHPATAEENEYAYMALAQWSPGLTEISTIPDPTRAMEAYFIGYDYQTFLFLPEDAPDGDVISRKGARITFDQPLEQLMDTEYVLSPISFEVIGDIHYGCIVEIGEDYVVHDRYDLGVGKDFELIGKPVRYELSPDAEMEYMEPLAPGSSCEIIVDDSGVVLAILERHG